MTLFDLYSTFIYKQALTGQRLLESDNMYTEISHYIHHLCGTEIL